MKKKVISTVLAVFLSSVFPHRLLPPTLTTQAQKPQREQKFCRIGPKCLL
jgi:hypothetical protein